MNYCSERYSAIAGTNSGDSAIESTPFDDCWTTIRARCTAAFALWSNYAPWHSSPELAWRWWWANSTRSGAHIPIVPINYWDLVVRWIAGQLLARLAW